MYSVKFQKAAQRTLDKLDEPTREKIIKWITETLDGCENPRLHENCSSE